MLLLTDSVQEKVIINDSLDMVYHIGLLAFLKKNFFNFFFLTKLSQTVRKGSSNLQICRNRSSLWIPFTNYASTPHECCLCSISLWLKTDGNGTVHLTPWIKVHLTPTESCTTLLSTRPWHCVGRRQQERDTNASIVKSHLNSQSSAAQGGKLKK